MSRGTAGRAGGLRRFRAALVLEARIALRYRVLPLAAVLAVLWAAAMALLPAAAARALAPFVLFLDTAGFGALIAVGLLLFERTEGAEAARAAAPLRPAEAVAARLVLLTAAAAAMALPVAAAVPADGPVPRAASIALVCAGVALTSVILVAVCMAAGARARTLLGAAFAAVPWVAPLVALPGLHLAGAADGPAVFAVPTTGAAELIRSGAAGVPPSASALAACAWTTVCAAAAWAWAARRAEPEEQARRGPAAAAALRPRPRAPRPDPRPEPRPGRVRGGAVAAFARFDLLGSAHDPLLAAIAVAPLPLALLLRFLYPPAAAFAERSQGLDPAPAAPALFAALVLLHVPVMAGSAVALRLIDDADERILSVLRASPLPPGAYLALRAASAAALALLGLAVAVPLSGLAPAPWPWPQALTAVLLAAAQAPLIVLATAALAGNKVEALVVVKAAGAVSVLLPVAAWSLPEAWGRALLLLPPAWPLLAVSGHPGEAAAPTVLLCGLAAAAAAGALAVLRAHRTPP
ncbi:fluoroquinolone export ABC transporter permease subunit [Nocardiopsis potens]|uniref:fluoroquinolone export ABC transporter permease subunit n=1 Tax=Nocardiopsis potens TaxID=1246458 RepID=UPI000593B6D5|nr:hypothetical protein [Nocardiopsis potens]